jgi:DNA/RNA-binding domain of Phe-tRNA-synthetase-like protein
VSAPAFGVEHRLAGWRLAWTRLELLACTPGQVAAMRRAAAERCRAAHSVESLSAEPVVAAVRRLFRDAGTDPTRYRPSSEALIRRLLKGDELPAIHPFVDLNNCLSVDLAVPACVMADGSFAPPVELRRGEPGERYDSLRGDFDLAGKPLLADGAGPFGTPITDSRRVAVGAGAAVAWLVAYLPAELLAAADVERALAASLAIAPLAHRSEVWTSGD